MSESELLELAFLALGNGLAAFAIFVTMLAAYVTAAYFVGKELNTRQLVIINCIFLVSMSGMTYVIYAFTSMALELYLEFTSINADYKLRPFSGLAYVNIAIDIAMIGAAIKFMTDVRSRDSGT